MSFERKVQQMSKRAIAKDIRLLMQTTPIFTKEIGQRLELARMKMKISQGELAKDLGISQPTISKLEAGKQAVTREPFTVAKFQAILGQHFDFVMFGLNMDLYPPQHTRDEYWKARLKRYNEKV